MVYKLKFPDTDEVKFVSHDELLRLANEERNKLYGKEQHPIDDIFTAMYYLDIKNIHITVL